MSKKLLATVSLAGLLAGVATVMAPLGANAQTALSGKVASSEEGLMEGVLVSAKKAGSTITTTVVSNAKGEFSFPAERLCARPLRHHHPRRRLRSRRARRRSMSRPAARRPPTQARQDQEDPGAALQRRMDHERAGQRSSQIVPAGLRRLPHAAARVLAPCTPPKNGRTCSRAWAAMRRKACRPVRSFSSRAARAANGRASRPT